jgi:GNAT superfamily N-acetyltransferase
MIRAAKPEDAEAISRVHVDSWRSTYRGIVPDDFLAKLNYEQRAKVRREQLEKNDPAKCTFVAEDDGKIVGFAMGGPRRDGDPSYDGELYAIYLFQQHQGRGHGRALLKAVAAWLRENKYKSMLVWVLEENPSKDFYKAHGAVELNSKTIEIGKPLLETSYGWPDISKIIF